MTSVALVVNYALAWVVLRNSSKVKNLIGKDGTLIISKIAALLLAAYSLAMLRSGVFEAITFWKSSP
jgi:multiple antibiotic resistance protein